MKRVVTIALLAVGALSLVASVVIFIERNQPSTQPLVELQRCGILMCFLDIEPNKTVLADAQTALKNSPEFMPSYFSANTAFKRTDPFYRIDLSGSSTICASYPSLCVGEVDLVFPLGYERLSAGQIISAFGPPCAISPFYLPKREVLIYPGMAFFFMSDLQSDTVRFLPTQLLIQASIFDNGKSCEVILSHNDSYYLWRGFTIYQKKQ